MFTDSIHEAVPGMKGGDGEPIITTIASPQAHMFISYASWGFCGGSDSNYRAYIYIEI